MEIFLLEVDAESSASHWRNEAVTLLTGSRRHKSQTLIQSLLLTGGGILSDGLATTQTKGKAGEKRVEFKHG